MELSSNCPPVLERTNVDNWKAKMEAYLKDIDEDVWTICVVKYTLPTEREKLSLRLAQNILRKLKGLLIVGT